MPSASRARAIRSASATASSTDAPWLRRLYSSVAAKAKCTSSSPVSAAGRSRARSAPDPRDDALAPLDRRDDLLGAGHLRHALGADEADRLDARHAGGGEPVDELGPHGGRERARLVLQPVPRPDVADRDRSYDAVLLQAAELARR